MLLALQNKCRNTCYSIIAPTTTRMRQRASALPRAKIEVLSISDADHAAIATPLASPHWFIEAGTHVPSPHWLYPRG
jgi:hypothetical protein